MEEVKARPHSTSTVYQILNGFIKKVLYCPSVNTITTFAAPALAPFAGDRSCVVVTLRADAVLVVPPA